MYENLLNAQNLFWRQNDIRDFENELLFEKSVTQDFISREFLGCHIMNDVHVCLSKKILVVENVGIWWVALVWNLV